MMHKLSAALLLLAAACATKQTAAPAEPAPAVAAADPSPRLLDGHAMEFVVDQPYGLAQVMMLGAIKSMMAMTGQKPDGEFMEMEAAFDAMNADATARWGLRAKLEEHLHQTFGPADLEALAGARDAGYFDCASKLVAATQNPLLAMGQAANVELSEGQSQRIQALLDEQVSVRTQNHTKLQYIMALQSYVAAQRMIANTTPEKRAQRQAQMDKMGQGLADEQRFLSAAAEQVNRETLAQEFELPFKLCSTQGAESYWRATQTGIGVKFEQEVIDAYYAMALPHLRADAGY